MRIPCDRKGNCWPETSPDDAIRIDGTMFIGGVGPPKILAHMRNSLQHEVLFTKGIRRAILFFSIGGPFRPGASDRGPPPR